MLLKQIVYVSRFEYDCDYDDDDADDDDDDDEAYQVERSVLLFNTWSDDGGPPRGVQTGYATAVTGSTLCNEEGDERRLIEEWAEDYDVGANLIHCNPASEWRRNKYTTTSMILPPESQGGDGDANTRTQFAWVHLMGDKNRRLFEEKVARIHVPETQMPHLVGALNEEIKVTHLRLKEERS